MSMDVTSQPSFATPIMRHRQLERGSWNFLWGLGKSFMRRRLQVWGAWMEPAMPCPSHDRNTGSDGLPIRLCNSIFQAPSS